MVNFETEDAIILYNNESDEVRKNNIFETKIKFALEKLVENVFNTFKLHSSIHTIIRNTVYTFYICRKHINHIFHRAN